MCLLCSWHVALYEEFIQPCFFSWPVFGYFVFEEMLYIYLSFADVFCFLLSFLSVTSMWQCKHCVVRESSRYKLLKHYKLHHHYGRSQHFLCIYVNCPCTFKMWSGLNTHVYRAHSSQVTQTSSSSVTFKCELCECSDLSTEKDFFVHIGTHL